MDLVKAKLVIWDLDETFWRGTLSEGKVYPIKRNILLVKELVDRGIMNSIVSKNDYAKAVDILKQWGIFDYFIFPQISWLPKGEVVKKLLKTCKLRAENALFIDDNISNIEEVKFYNPGISAELPNILDDNILNFKAFFGKVDTIHSRLNQYKALEKRTKAETKYSSNEIFLRASHIKIEICEDCMSEIDRIEELIQRTNQVNYTKKRLALSDIDELLRNKQYICRYVKAKDDFGDYGIVGFYALKNNCLEHFLFSCRTLGFGIENYLYMKLGYPKIKIEGNVTTSLDRDINIDWIEEIVVSNRNDTSVYTVKNLKRIKMLMIAGCDIEQACSYLENSYLIDKEFTTVVEGREIRTSDTTSLVNIVKLDAITKKELCDNLPFLEDGITFNSKIFSGIYDIIVISVVDDYIRGIYKNKKQDFYVGYGGYYDQDEFINIYGKDKLKYLFDNFDFIGKESVDVFEENLKFIISQIPKTTHIIIINGIELDVSNWIGADRVERNIEMNSIVDKVVLAYDNVHLIDMRNIVTSKDMLIKNDNRHFDRNVYYRMAEDIVKMCNQILGFQLIKTQNKYLVNSKNLVMNMVNRVTNKKK